MKTKLSKKQVLLAIVCGAFVGVLNGFFGGGGGMVCVPLLEKIFKFDNKVAHASTLVVILPLCIASSVVYLLYNEISSINLLYISIGTIVGGVLGAILLKKLSCKVVRIIFSVIMLVAGVKMVM